MAGDAIERQTCSTAIDLEVRQCPSCKRTFKTAPGSPVIYDSYFCENLDKDKPTHRPLRVDQIKAQPVQYLEPVRIPKRKWRKRGPKPSLF